MIGINTSALYVLQDGTLDLLNMKTQRINRKNLKRYLFEEIVVEAMVKEFRDDKTLLVNVIIPEQLGFNAMNYDHMWVDKELFSDDYIGKKVAVVGEVYYYQKGYSNYSYSLKPKEVNLIRKEKKWKNY